MKTDSHDHKINFQKPDFIIQFEQENLSNLTNIINELNIQSEHLVLEIGCGHGRFLTQYAKHFSDKFCIGVDLISKRLRFCDKKKTKLSLNNVVFLKAKAEDMIKIINDKKVSEIFVLFPDPWPKKRHHKNRLMQNEFINNLHILCHKHAKIFFRTDHVEYFEWTKSLFEINENFKIREDLEWPFEQNTYFQDLADSFKSLIIEII